MGSKCRWLVDVWETTQVKLHGRYSSSRVQNLANYTREISWVQAAAITVVTPLPCLAVTLFIDVMPLANPFDGVEANKLLFVREYYAFVVMTTIALHQFRTGVRVLPYPIKSIARDALVISGITVGVLYGLVLLVGFPLPFMNVIAMPVWAALVAIALVVQWKGTIRTTPGASLMLVGTIKLWLCEFLLVFIYPPYFYAFSVIPDSTAKMVFALLLPLIKLTMRNLFSRAVCHLGDETPVLVVFHADVFGSLNVAYCMQSSPLLWMTLAIMALDIVFMGLSLREIEIVRKELEVLERRPDIMSSYHNANVYAKLRGRKLTTLEKASTVIQQERAPALFLGIYPDLMGFDVEQGPQANYLGEHDMTHALPKEISTQFHQPAQGLDMTKKFVGKSRVQPDIGQVDTSIKRTYAIKVRRLLYMTEFALLLNYIEVIIPLVFSIYLVATYHLPNRDYYPMYDKMEEQQLLQTLDNVLLYCLLQFVSFLYLIVMLKRLIGHSPIQQIAFVLERQVDWVQMCLVFWLFYNVQGSLRHLGYDYTFKFKWLSETSRTGS